MRPPATPAASAVVERCQGICGELALRRVQLPPGAGGVSGHGSSAGGAGAEQYEIISDGMFLMATYNRQSEEALGREAVACWRELREAPAQELREVPVASPATTPPCSSEPTARDWGPRVLVGGLGVGYTVAAVLAEAPDARCDVVELEPVVVDWHSRYLAAYSGNPLDDPRVRLLVGDVGRHLRRVASERPGSYDIVLLDTDNGPGWLASAANAALYSGGGLRAVHAALDTPGVAAYWSASASPAFARRLRSCFGHTRSRRVPSEAALTPDVIYFGLKLHGDVPEGE